MAIRFTWDPKKAKRNLRRHKIAFEVAQNAFFDPHIIIVEDLDYEGENRFHAIGFCTEKLLVVVVFIDLSETEADEVIHIISARKAESDEELTYADQFA